MLNKDGPFPTNYSARELIFVCLLNMVVAILLYHDDIIYLSKSRACLQRYMNKLYEFLISYSLDVNLSKTEIMIFGRNKRRLNQKAFYFAKNQI